ncbi:Pyridoxine/pyridoxamine 5'-phosphate oxidase [Candidatus Hepatincolaceae symbiont of Richtersius coronifer]
MSNSFYGETTIYNNLNPENLSVNTTLSNILEIFTHWYKEAKVAYEKQQLQNYNGFSLSTCFDNQPSSRYVLLGEYSQKGFIFYTNLNSRKSSNIKTNPKVAMLFYWGTLKRQIRIEGTAHIIDDFTADKYFANRPYLSKVGAWASKQSLELKASKDLEYKVQAYSAKFPQKVPRPPNWSGFTVQPHYFEFWEEREFRLHKRVFCSKIMEDNWKTGLLYP